MSEREFVEITLFTDDVERAKAFYERLVGGAPRRRLPRAG